MSQLVLEHSWLCKFIIIRRNINMIFNTSIYSRLILVEIIHALRLPSWKRRRSRHVAPHRTFTDPIHWKYLTRFLAFCHKLSLAQFWSIAIGGEKRDVELRAGKPVIFFLVEKSVIFAPKKKKWNENKIKTPSPRIFISVMVWQEQVLFKRDLIRKKIGKKDLIKDYMKKMQIQLGSLDSAITVFTIGDPPRL